MRHSILLLILLPAIALPAFAQPTNVEAFQSLALQCMDFLEDVDALEVQSTARMPYIRSALITKLHENGRQVYLSDSLYTDKPTHLNRLTYQIEAASVSYERRKRKKAERTVQLTLKTALVSSKGRIMADKLCEKSLQDTVAISQIAMLESPYPETQGIPPKAGFGKRVIQPIMLTAATTLTIYLFFTLRSDSDEN